MTDPLAADRRAAARAAGGRPALETERPLTSTLREELDDVRAELARARSALRELSKVGMALMSERDPRQLFDLILKQARALTTSDAGSLYLVETHDDTSVLHFLHSQNDTLPGLPSLAFKLPLDDASIAGYVATTAEPLMLADVYHLPEEMPFSFNREVFDERYGYRAKSMLAVPMIDHKDRVVGVLQLINRKIEAGAAIHTDEDASRWVLPYTGREVAIVSSLAGQAAVSIENGRLYQDIENLFAGFIKAAVTAIDRRDPATSGHSVRVTELTCDMAKLINARDEGPFADVCFSDEELKQLRYAGLLHDFGKVGVREEVLVKAMKMPPVVGARVEARFALIRRSLEAEAAAAKADALAAKAEAVAAEAESVPERVPEGGRAGLEGVPGGGRVGIEGVPEGGRVGIEGGPGGGRTGFEGVPGGGHTGFEGVPQDTRVGIDAELAAIDAKLTQDLAELAAFWEVVQDANIPRALDEEAAEVLKEIAGKTYVDADGAEEPYLTPEEVHYLSIRRGSLDIDERRQIESHVIHSYDFLLEIPWTEELSRIAEIVRGHHEKLDGSGYPDGVGREALSLETRIMTVCDIFDALTASDRPYKKAMPVGKALEVLRAEAEAGQLDPNVVALFIESGVYRKVLERHWREF